MASAEQTSCHVCAPFRMQETAEELIAEADKQSDIVFTTDAVLISKMFAQAKLGCPLCHLLAYGITICLDQSEGLSARGPLLLHRKYIPRTARFGFETLSQSLTPAFGFEVLTERGRFGHSMVRARMQVDVGPG